MKKRKGRQTALEQFSFVSKSGGNSLSTDNLDRNSATTSGTCKVEVDIPDEEWSCSKCTFLNPALLLCCEICGNVKQAIDFLGDGTKGKPTSFNPVGLNMIENETANNAFTATTASTKTTTTTTEYGSTSDKRKSFSDIGYTAKRVVVSGQSREEAFNPSNTNVTHPKKNEHENCEKPHMNENFEQKNEIYNNNDNNNSNDLSLTENYTSLRWVCKVCDVANLIELKHCSFCENKYNSSSKIIGSKKLTSYLNHEKISVRRSENYK
eukprot:Awhi_evm1s4418